MDISKLRKKAKEQQAGAKQKAAESKQQTPDKQTFDTVLKAPDSGQQIQTPGPSVRVPMPEVRGEEPATGIQDTRAGAGAPESGGHAAEGKPFAELAVEELKKYPAETREKELLCFTLEEEEYAIELNVVKEIIRVKEITPVPNTSDFVLGIIVLRGEIIPIVDLRKRIGLPFLNFTQDTRFIMVSFEDTMTGLVVDSIPMVKKVLAESIQSAELVSNVDIKFVAGISTSNGGFTILLKLEEILKQSDMLKV